GAAAPEADAHPAALCVLTSDRAIDEGAAATLRRLLPSSAGLIRRTGGLRLGVKCMADQPLWSRQASARGPTLPTQERPRAFLAWPSHSAVKTLIAREDTQRSATQVEQVEQVEMSLASNNKLGQRIPC